MVEMDNYIAEDKVRDLLNQKYQEGIAIGSSLVILQLLSEMHKDDPIILRELIHLRKMLGEQIPEIPKE